MSRLLDVHFKDRKAGELEQDENASLTFTYDSDYLATEPVALSVSLPMREESFLDRIARPLFSGLLPDEGARRRLAAALGISSGNAFGLLEIIGGECAGPLSSFRRGFSHQLPRKTKPRLSTRTALRTSSRCSGKGPCWVIKPTCAFRLTVRK